VERRYKEEAERLEDALSKLKTGYKTRIYYASEYELLLAAELYVKIFSCRDSDHTVRGIGRIPQ